MEKISDVFVLSKKETLIRLAALPNQESTGVDPGEPISKPSDDVLNKIKGAASKDQIININ